MFTKYLPNQQVYLLYFYYIQVAREIGRLRRRGLNPQSLNQTLEDFAELQRSNVMFPRHMEDSSTQLLPSSRVGIRPRVHVTSTPAATSGRTYRVRSLSDSAVGGVLPTGDIFRPRHTRLAHGLAFWRRLVPFRRQRQTTGSALPGPPSFNL